MVCSALRDLHLTLERLLLHLDLQLLLLHHLLLGLLVLLLLHLSELLTLRALRVHEILLRLAQIRQLDHVVQRVVQLLGVDQRVLWHLRELHLRLEQCLQRGETLLVITGTGSHGHHHAATVAPRAGVDVHPVALKLVGHTAVLEPDHEVADHLVGRAHPGLGDRSHHEVHEHLLRRHHSLDAMRGLVVHKIVLAGHVRRHADPRLLLYVGVLEKLKRLSAEERATQLGDSVVALGPDNAAGSVDEEVVNVDLTLLHDLDAVHGLVERVQRGSQYGGLDVLHLLQALEDADAQELVRHR